MQITVTPNKETVASIGELVEEMRATLLNMGKLISSLDKEVEVDPNEQTLELVEDAKSAVAYAIDAQNELVDNVSEAESGISNVTYSLEELASQLEKSADALDSIC